MQAVYEHAWAALAGRGRGQLPPCPSTAPSCFTSLYLNDIDVRYRAYMLAPPLALVPALLCPL